MCLTLRYTFTMKRWLRRLLVTWMLVAVPIHGLAAMAMQVHAMGANIISDDTTSGNDATVAPCHAPAAISNHDDSDDAGATHTCGLCIVCGTGTGIASTIIAPAPSSYTATMYFAASSASPPAFLTGGQDRPPRVPFA